MTSRTTHVVLNVVLNVLLVLLFVLHNDLWLWDDASTWLGLPAGLTYHILYCVVVSALMLGFVTWAWPDLDDHE